MNKILLTGGLGYIGSHVAVELADQGLDMIIIDDLSNSELFVLDRLRQLTKRDIHFEKGDVRNISFLRSVFQNYDITKVIHFAAKKAVDESINNPLLYYDLNVGGLMNLLKVIKENPIEQFIFSSSCTVYGIPEKFPVTEDTPLGHTPSPYGKTKQMCEQILESISSKSEFRVVALRYFNPVGAHPSAEIGELPKGIPNNLVPFITQTCAGLRKELKIFGGNYHTPDGTAIRDYIHVVDLAKAHVKALEIRQPNYIVLNVGTGRGYSVLEVVKSFEKVVSKKVPFLITSRRKGDVPIIYGDASKAEAILDWKAELGLNEMLRDAWKWQGMLKSRIL